MKTFKDLEFKEHNVQPMFATQARIMFGNGYGVSVITGDSAYSSESKPYEVAVLDGNGITYETSVSDDVLGHQSEADVTDIMRKVQEL